MIFTTRSDCRICGSSVVPLVPLGDQPLNCFRNPGDPSPSLAPITLGQCAGCGHVQTLETTDRDLLFRQYHYETGISPQMVAEIRGAIDEALEVCPLKKGDTVLSIGTNDGAEAALLPPWTWKIGFDPSLNLSETAATRCDEFHATYFPGEMRPPAGDYRAKLIVSLACLYSVDDLHAFVSAIREWLHPEGVWLLQVSNLAATLFDVNVGDLCHEHLSFFSVTSLVRLLTHHGLSPIQVSLNKTNGGSIRMIVRHGSGPPFDSRFTDVPSPEDLTIFWDRIREQGNALRSFLLRNRTYGLGASTKANLMLAVHGIGPDHLPAIADRNPKKQGKVTVTDIPIISEEEARSLRPRYFCALIPHFLESLREREKDFLDNGGRILLPNPLPHLDGDDDPYGSS